MRKRLVQTVAPVAVLAAIAGCRFRSSVDGDYTCTRDSHCSAGEHCVDGACVPPVGPGDAAPDSGAPDAPGEDEADAARASADLCGVVDITRQVTDAGTLIIDGDLSGYANHLATPTLSCGLGVSALGADAFYTIELAEGDRLQASALPDGWNVIIYVVTGQCTTGDECHAGDYDPQGTGLAQAIDLVAPRDDTYYLVVDNLGNGGPYRLEVTITPGS